VAGSLALALVFLGSPGLAAEGSRSAAEQRGDAAWARRDRAFLATRSVDPQPAHEAVAAYEEALQAEPDDVALRLKTIEALYFAGHFAAAGARERRELSSRQLELAESALTQLEPAADPGGRAELEPAARARRLESVPLAREVYFWSAISWGVWARAHGNMAAARRDAAARIRDRALTLIALDESFASAGGLRLLGRLHTTAPKVPLFSGWIDRREGLLLLRRANAMSQADPRNPLFLAEAILEYEPQRRAEALGLLREVAGRTPEPDQLVEQSEIVEQARATLARAERTR
jgi:hypothetical protein